MGFAYPALQAACGFVNLRLFSSEPEARESHVNGVVELYRLHFAEKLKVLKKMSRSTLR